MALWCSQSCVCSAQTAQILEGLCLLAVQGSVKCVALAFIWKKTPELTDICLHEKTNMVKNALRCPKAMKTGRHANENSGIGALLLIREQPGTTSGRKTITTAKPLPAIDLDVSSFGSRTPRFIKHEESMSALQFNARDAVGGEDDNPSQKFSFYSNRTPADVTGKPTCRGTN